MDIGAPKSQILPKGTDGEAAFDEPWQVQVLALADTLIGNGVFSANAWSAALGAELQRATQGEAPDTAASYYEAALRALEGLLQGQIAPTVLSNRHRAWERAYRETPHAQPVRLEND